MQYKDSPKIMIDKRKLEILFRLGCPDAQIIELLKTKKFTPTGDSLIDETLESLIDFKVFENWGGFRIGSGRKHKKSGIKNQDANQDANQVVDKDRDNNIYIYNNYNSRNLIPDTNTQDNNKLSGISNNISTTHACEKEKIKENFDIFWESYTPVKASDGYVVAKGSKKVSFEKYSKVIKLGVKPEDILKGLKSYIDFCQKNNRLTCGVPVFLNQERWKDEYNAPTVIAQPNILSLSARERQDLINKQKTEALLKKLREQGN